jgi:hypothetical protein
VPPVVKKMKVKKEYTYKERAVTPYWYDQDPKMYIEALNEESMMSIDSAYDPEFGVDIRFYEEISRMLDYKKVIHKYMI